MNNGHFEVNAVVTRKAECFCGADVSGEVWPARSGTGKP